MKFEEILDKIFKIVMCICFPFISTMIGTKYIKQFNYWDKSDSIKAPNKGEVKDPEKAQDKAPDNGKKPVAAPVAPAQPVAPAEKEAE